MRCRKVDSRRNMAAPPWGDPIKEEQVTSVESGGEREPCWALHQKQTIQDPDTLQRKARENTEPHRPPYWIQTSSKPAT